jgi:[methyl-Co(III) methanol-specific corrinoid protein]:coenzyme M methyltransferase
MVAQTGLSCFHWDTKTGRPDEIRALAGPRLALMGGVSNFTLLRGTAEEVATQVQAAVIGDIDVVGPECAIPLAAPLANLKIIAAQKSP